MRLTNLTDEGTAELGPFHFRLESGFTGHTIWKQIDTRNEHLLIVNSSTLEVVRSIKVDELGLLEIL